MNLVPAKKLIRSAAVKWGYEVARARPSDCSDEEWRIVQEVKPFTMTSTARILTLLRAVEFVLQSGIDGAFVECGVWRGGSMMAVARRLMDRGVSDRDLYLFDTYEGMTAPTTLDRRLGGGSAEAELERASPNDSDSVWCRATLAEVKQNMASTGYPSERIQLVVGPVQDTLPGHAPKGGISLLRLDTDWYESTAHELTHLYPRVREFGIVLVDDYWHWEGSKRAVDEFLKDDGPVFLPRIDNSGTVFQKMR